MLHKGMAIIIRNKDELEVFAQAANRTGYKFRRARIRSLYTPVRVSINTDGYLTQCDDLNYPLNDGITEVVEASQLFRNQLISERRKQNVT